MAAPPDQPQTKTSDAIDVSSAPDPYGLGAGQRVGPYRVVGKLGEGGFGAVYECVHTTIERRAALKVLRRDVSQKPGFAVRFFNEARAANRVPHPGVVQVFDCGQLPDGTLYLLMEFVEGATLHSHMQAAAQTPKASGEPGVLGLDVLPILHQLAIILATAHKQGIVHRDLKPSNVMLVPDSTARGGERVRLLDFGIAKLLGDAIGPPSGTPGSGAHSSPRTETGAILGTPAYMAPEQAAAPSTVNDRADVYALGVIAYQALVGCLPITGPTPWAILMGKTHDSPRPLSEHDPSLPADLEHLVMAMLSVVASERPSAAEIERELATMLGLSAPRKSRLSGPVTAPAPTSPPDPPTVTATPPGPVPAALPATPSSKNGAENPAATAATISGAAPHFLPPARVASPSAPTVNEKRSWLGLAAGLAALLAIAAVLAKWLIVPGAPSAPHLPPAAPAANPVDLADNGARLPLPDLGIAHDLAPHPSDAAAAPTGTGDSVLRPTGASRGKGTPGSAGQSCVRPRAGCVRGSGFDDRLRQSVLAALLDAQIQVCGSERFLFDVSPQELVLIDIPSRLSKSDQKLLRGALRSRLVTLSARVSVEVQCKK